MYILMYMKKTNALKLRQSLGMILKDLQKTGQPLLVEKDRKPAAVLITVEDYFKRFVDREADEQRKELVSRIAKTKLKLPKNKTSLEIGRAHV